MISYLFTSEVVIVTTLICFMNISKFLIVFRRFSLRIRVPISIVFSAMSPEPYSSRLKIKTKPDDSKLLYEEGNTLSDRFFPIVYLLVSEILFFFFLIETGADALGKRKIHIHRSVNESRVRVVLK